MIQSLRADANLPLSFTESFGSWNAISESGHHADDNQGGLGWGNSADSCSGRVLFGTPDTILKTGGEWGGDFNSTTNGDNSWTQAQTTVPVGTTIRWESNQECAMPDESVRVKQTSLWLR